MKIDQNIRCIVLFAVLTCIASLAQAKPSVSTLKNHELLGKLGLQKTRGPNTHHRKRLAVESRHHSRSDDSHMFVIKLPPNQHYYAYNQPNSIVPSKSKKLPLGFKSNGKPGKIYHWNIPVIKKIVQNKQKSLMMKKGANNPPPNNAKTNAGVAAAMDIENPESWNEVLKQDEREQHRKPIKPSYYVPAKPKKSSFMKYFPGNGKPHSFYVIEKSKKAHYHRLLP